MNDHDKAKLGEDEKGDADKVFAAPLHNLVNTPHKPLKGRGLKPAPK
jgi:hypothetical protein